MIIHPDVTPRLRPVEPFLMADKGAIGVRDPSGLSSVMLTLTEPAFFILTLLDGNTTLARIQQQFLARYAQPIALDTVTDLITRLEESLLLEGPRFEAHYQDLLTQYRAEPVRPMRSASALGLDGDAQTLFREMLADEEASADAESVRGIIAPHLDYPRGRPCYSAAYNTLAGLAPPARVVILGTNHFGVGGGGSVVATGKDFATPLGTTSTDGAFLESLETECGDLRRHEYDHLAEHSVELQVCWLQHVFGAENFRIVPFLCPDPCGPTGTAPGDGKGIDLADFARVLRAAIQDDHGSTLVVAGADFSHVGGFFGDQRPLDDDFLTEVRERDFLALQRIEQGDPAAFRACVAEDRNPTRVCSAGCLFALMTVMQDARTTVLKYHQAVEPEAQNCVTCAAVVFRQ